MSIISKLLESVHLNGDDEEDDYYLDDDYEDEDDRPARKGLFAKKMTMTITMMRKSTIRNRAFCHVLPR